MSESKKIFIVYFTASRENCFELAMLRAFTDLKEARKYKVSKRAYEQSQGNYEDAEGYSIEEVDLYE